MSMMLFPLIDSSCTSQYVYWPALFFLMTTVLMPLVIFGLVLVVPGANFQPNCKRKSGRDISVLSLLKSTFISLSKA